MSDVAHSLRAEQAALADQQQQQQRRVSQETKGDDLAPENVFNEVQAKLVKGMVAVRSHYKHTHYSVVPDPSPENWIEAFEKYQDLVIAHDERIMLKQNKILLGLGIPHVWVMAGVLKDKNRADMLKAIRTILDAALQSLGFPRLPEKVQQVSFSDLKNNLSGGGLQSGMAMLKEKLSGKVPDEVLSTVLEVMAEVIKELPDNPTVNDMQNIQSILWDKMMDPKLHTKFREFMNPESMQTIAKEIFSNFSF